MKSFDAMLAHKSEHLLVQLCMRLQALCRGSGKMRLQHEWRRRSKWWHGTEVLLPGLGCPLLHLKASRGLSELSQSIQRPMAATLPSSGGRGQPWAAEDAQDGEPGALLAAVIDNRVGEVGLAVLDAGGGALLLAQHVESSRTFTRTL